MNTFDTSKFLETTSAAAALLKQYTAVDMQLRNLSNNIYELESKVLELLKPIAKGIGFKLPERPDQCEGIPLALICLLFEEIQKTIPPIQTPLSGVRHRQDQSGNDRWQARIDLPGGSSPSLGVYDTVAEANAAIKAAKRVLDLMNSQEVESENPVTPIEFNPESGNWTFNGKSYSTYIQALKASKQLMEEELNQI